MTNGAPQRTFSGTSDAAAGSQDPPLAVKRREPVALEGLTVVPLFAAIPARLGDPVSYQALTVVPLLAAERPSVQFVSLDEALARGLSVEEVDDAGAVESVTVRNPLPCAVLLYEGEEITGGKQDRVIARPVLVSERSTVQVPVFCVEHGRWSSRSQRFTSSPYAAFPSARRAGSIVGQAGVWREVEAKMERLGVGSDTDAANELYAASSRTLDAYCAAFPAQPAQCGALILVRGRGGCVDYVSRPDVHADIHAKLVRGYALDAIAAASETPASAGSVDDDLSDASVDLLAEVAAARKEPVRTAGCGELRQLLSNRVTGWELRNGGEVIALSIVEQTANATVDGRAGRP